MTRKQEEDLLTSVRFICITCGWFLGRSIGDVILSFINK